MSNSVFPVNETSMRRATIEMSTARSRLSNGAVYGLSGVCLVAGGLIALIAHLVHPRQPDDLAGAADYLRAAPAAHVVLFTGVLLVVLGLPGLYARLSASAGLGALLGCAMLFLGIVFCDLTHCPLEFGVGPALREMPAAVAGEIFEKAYSQSPLAVVQLIGQPIVLVGALLLAWGARRAPGLLRWPGLFMCAFVGLFVAGFVPGLSHYAGHLFPVSLYLGFALYGVALGVKE